jgi:hypothetical protein
MVDITVGAGGGQSACNSKSDEDKDMDGWSTMDGDCNDCDPNVNPGAIEVKVTMAQGDGGIPEPADEDCDGTIDNVAPTCDDNLVLNDPNPNDAAKAIDLCQTASANPATKKDRKWGVLEAKYVSADGTKPRTPGLQTGLLDKFGTNVTTQLGKSMLGLSSGRMRTPGQSGFCPSQGCTTMNAGTPPQGFPQGVEGCPAPSNLTIHDDIALEVKVRAPTNAVGYKFDFRFYSYEYAEYVCSNYNDQFVALVNPAPPNAINGNISFDSLNHPVSVNIAFFDVCDPAGKLTFAQYCPGNCPLPPNPYCEKGTFDLVGTGMEVDAGATSWLQTSAPVTGGEELSIRFAIWDTFDDQVDSSVLVDAFQWTANGGTVTVGTVIKPPA